MTKLINIVKELDWPGSCYFYVTQDSNSLIYGSEEEPVLTCSRGQTGGVLYSYWESGEEPCEFSAENGELADDWETAIITRAQYLEARVKRDAALEHDRVPTDENISQEFGE